MEVFDLKRKLLRRPPGGRNGRESSCGDPSAGNDGKPAAVATARKRPPIGATAGVRINRAQAGALAKLIRAQLAAYDEAEGGERRGGGIPEEPFTGEDLDTLLPLLAPLERRAVCRPGGRKGKGGKGLP